MMDRMRTLLLGTAFCLTAMAGWAQSQTNPVVVELFTSQGCSSCPAADALLAELGGREDVIPLALHVDYWDYIGWEDAFADPRFTKRQKGYARAGGWKMIYTPQIIINGEHDVVGNRPMKVADGILHEAQEQAQVSLDIRREGDALHIAVTPMAPVKPCDIHLVRYVDGAEVDILRGENAGRSLTYTHIVRGWDVVGQWDGQGTYEATVPVTGSDPIVVLVQDKRYGSIVAAARLR